MKTTTNKAGKMTRRVAGRTTKKVTRKVAGKVTRRAARKVAGKVTGARRRRSDDRQPRLGVPRLRERCARSRRCRWQQVSLVSDCLSAV